MASNFSNSSKVLIGLISFLIISPNYYVCTKFCCFFLEGVVIKRLSPSHIYFVLPVDWDNDWYEQFVGSFFRCCWVSGWYGVAGKQKLNCNQLLN